MSDISYELYAIKYATNQTRTRLENLMVVHDLHDTPMPLDFYVWLAVSADRVVLIDSGADAATCSKRGHEFLACPAQAMSTLGIEPEKVTDLIITHLHWDHAGNLSKFPNARLYIHQNEAAHATGPCMCHPYLRRPYDVEHVCLLIRALYGDRLEFVKADREIAPGISVHHVGGHTPGLQVARVRTARGWVVLASDAMHFYENWTKATPFPVLVNLDEYLDAFKKIEGLADSHDHIVAGHDPLVINAYPPVSGMQGVACQLHAPPRSGIIFS